MIEAETFVRAACEAGYRFWSGVPCSFLTTLINQVIDDPQTSWVGAANEGDAVAMAAGAHLGGLHGVALMQNSGLGNAVNPITSLLQAFEIPVLLLVTWRGDPELRDEPQHRLMGGITPRLLELMDVGWELFPQRSEDIAPVLLRAAAHMAATRRPYALLVRKGSVAGPARAPRPWTRPGVSENAAPAGGGARPEPRFSRRDVLAAVVARTPVDRAVVVATTGYTGRELCALDDRPNQLYMVGSMGCASSLGLGLALARPDLEIVVVDGDGALLMRLGNLATAGAYAGENFTHVVVDNGVHDSTGGQGTVAPALSFAALARACGYRTVEAGADPALLASVDRARPGPRFVHLVVAPGAPADLPRPELGPPEVRARLQRHLGAHR